MINIYKKIILCLLIVIFLIVLLNYLKPIQVTDLIDSYNSDTLPNNITAYVYFSIFPPKEFEVKGQESISKIIKLLGDIKVRKLLKLPDTFNPKFKNTYRLFINGNSGALSIRIVNKDYIEINNKSYKIIESPDLSYLYDIIILDQPTDELDEFYKNLIN